MPHKRAKRSVRQREQAQRGTDAAPSGGGSLAQEAVPKSMTRVLQAESVRKAYKEKRLREDDVPSNGERDPKRRKKEEGVGQKQPEIKHGESIAHYNRRVEDDMRVAIAEAMHASRNSGKRAKKADTKLANAMADQTVGSKPDKDATSTRKTEFDRKPSTKRLNDIVQAPPSLTKLPRGASKTKGKTGAAVKTEGVVSMAQKQKMEEERDRAIKRYRELREARNVARNDAEHVG